jgi:peptidyl-prolyl cis-trans isomerase A (cyclophilin A)
VFADLHVTSSARVTLLTTLGAVHCELDTQRAPRGTSLFLALATGRARWKDPLDGRIRDDPMYRDLAFHRSIPGVMVQSGCPKGDSSGHPGYRIPSETDGGDVARLRAPGALALARYTPPPLREDPDPPLPGHVHGSQFFVTLTDMSHLAGQVTVLGRCRDLSVVAALARAVRGNPEPPRLERVEVE